MIPCGADDGIPCEVQLDPTFFDLPRIRLLEIPPELPNAVPHLGAEGGLCYLAKGTVVLDIYDPVGQSLACLQRAAAVLGQILKGEMIEDLAEEFFAYWNGWLCFVDMQGEDLGRQNCIVAQANGNPLWFITDNEDRTTRKLHSLGYQVTDKTVLTYRVKTTAQPRPLTSHWPPKRWGRLGLAKHPGPTVSAQDSRTNQGRAKQKANGVLIIIESPLMTYGFAVLFDHQVSQRPSLLIAGIRVLG